MKNPTRRNRNIGTAKQGYGENNELVVPIPVFAHSYADKIKKDLILKGIVPFDRIINEIEINKNGLNLSDFKE